jgi:diaminobutyrate-2-oxoglutarate transaminase
MAAGTVSATFGAEPRGRGLVHCLAFEDGVSAAAFERGLLVETAGPRGEAVKLLPPLTITDAELDRGLELLADAVRSVC